MRHRYQQDKTNTAFPKSEAMFNKKEENSVVEFTSI